MTHSLPYTQLSRGCLLLASPDISSGLYFRGVILLCEHASTGSFGLLINKPLEVDFPEDMINLKDIPNPRVQIRAGGPLQPSQMMVLHSEPLEGEQTLKICEGVFLGGNIQFLQEALSNCSGPAIRLCFGLCGWGPGQLEKEFLSGLWFLHPASSTAIFETPSDQLWRLTLRQMGGKYATLSMIPDDLSLN